MLFSFGSTSCLTDENRQHHLIENHGRATRDLLLKEIALYRKMAQAAGMKPK
jgi:hypothetical protein